MRGEFVAFVVESLRPLGPVSARRMFGGHGIFLDGVMFGLIADDQLYLKADEENRAAYEAEDLLSGERYLWHGPRNYVELNPTALSGHILKIHRHLKVETDFEYFL